MLNILGIVVMVVAAVLAFRTASQYDRNAVGWTFAVVGVGIGLQFIIPITIAIVIGVVMILQGKSEAEMRAAVDVSASFINVICIGLSVVGMMMILKYLSKVPEEASFTPPPTPPNF